MDARGFTLVETMVAITIVAIALTSLAQLFVIATRANLDARFATTASILAVQKIEQLRSLASDLQPQDANALSANVPGACDFLDEYGRILGTGSRPLPNTVYIRRWTVAPLADAADVFVLQVAVFPRSARDAPDPPHGDARALGGAHIVTLKRRGAG